jgi:hypothetical protein
LNLQQVQEKVVERLCRVPFALGNSVLRHSKKTVCHHLHHGLIIVSNRQLLCREELLIFLAL